MRRCIVLLAAFGLGLGLTSQARADIAPPLPPNKEGVAIKIEVDEKAKGPRLVVPSGVINPPRFRPKFEQPKGELEREDGDAVAQDTPANEKPQNHLMFAGLALSFAFAFGGLWLLRKNGRGSIRGLSLLIVAGASLAVGAIAWANAPPPQPKKERPPVRPVPEAFPLVYEGKAKVEFTFGQEPVRLILDKESFEKLKKGELKLPAALPPE